MLCFFIGYGILIGKEIGKVLQFEIRSKSCSVCDYYVEGLILVYQCIRNWDGFSKVMELDMVMFMFYKMKDSGYLVQIIYGDNDFIIFFFLKLEFFEIRKKDDKNYIKKGILKKLYILVIKWKEFKFQLFVILYLVRCFMYVFVKVNISDDVYEGFLQIVFYIFGEYKLCSDDWCLFLRDFLNFR